MGSTSHLKRHSMPSSWGIKRKNITFITKPNPGSNKREYVVPVVALLRDILGYAKTLKEVKHIVNTEEILVNNKQVKDVKYPVGIFEIFEIKKTKEKFVVIFDNFGKIKLVPQKDDLVYLRVSGKVQLSTKKFQLNFMNGFNTLVDQKTFKQVKVQDTIVFDLSKKKVSSIFNLVEKTFVYIFDGNFKGQFAEIKSFLTYNGLARNVAEIKIGNNVHTTAKDYCYVIGTKKEDLKRFS